MILNVSISDGRIPVLMLHLIPGIKCSLVLPYIYIYHQYGIVCIILPLPRWVSRLHVSSQLANKPRFHPSALGADFHPLYLHSSSAAFANTIQKEYLCKRNIYIIVLELLLLCRPTFLCRSSLNRDISQWVVVTALQTPLCAEARADTQHCGSYRFQNQGWIAAKCPDWAHRLIFSLVSCLQVSSPPGWRRPLQFCLTLSRVFQAVTQSPCTPCKHRKGSFCLKLFWVDGGVIVPLVKCLSCCLLFCLLHCQLLLSFLPPLQERCVVFGTHRYKHPRASRSLAGIAVWPFMVWWKAASPGLWSIQNPPHFTKYTGGKKRGVAFHACLLTVRFFF